MAISAQSGGIDATLTALQGDWSTGRNDDKLLPLGAAYLRAGKTDDALALLDDLLGDRPDWTDARLMRADARLAAQDFDGAEADLAAAADLSPDRAEIHADLARLRLSLDGPMRRMPASHGGSKALPRITNWASCAPIVWM